MGNPTYGLPVGFEEPQGFDMLRGANPACRDCSGTGWFADWQAGEMLRCGCVGEPASPYADRVCGTAYSIGSDALEDANTRMLRSRSGDCEDPFRLAATRAELDPPMGWAGLAIALGALGASWALVWALFRLAEKA